MRDVLLSNALAHEFQRSRDAFEYYAYLHTLVLSGSYDKKVSVACYNAYSDFVSHLYEFYLGCIKSDARFPRRVRGAEVDSILNQEVRRILKIRRERILRGDAETHENAISYYEVDVPEEFGFQFRTVRNIRSHAMSERSTYNLADFYLKYHRFIYLLFVEPQWSWNMEKFPDHYWHAIEEFSKAISVKTERSGG